MAKKKGNRTSGKAIRSEYESWLHCVPCGTLTSIFRPRQQVRDVGHRKHIYCFTCRKITLHIEHGEGYTGSWTWDKWGLIARAKAV